MTVTLTIPDELSGSISQPDVSRAFLEAFALEGYRSERLTVKDVRTLLGHESRFQTERFLAEHGALASLSADEILADAAAAHGARRA